MTIRILFFATIKDLTGQSHLELDLAEGITVSGLISHLADLYPNAQGILSRTLVAINQKFAGPDDLIPGDAEIAIFPPVSGGSKETPTLCKITSDLLDLDALVREITLTSTGAVCVFTGVVRGETMRGDPHQTVMLDYEAYVPMAEAKMMQVANEIRTRWPAVEGVAIVQRIGKLEPGTPTVVIACSASHRDTGVFEAARYGIDRLKEIVPVWKKEIGPGGEEWIEGSYLPKPGE